MRIFTPHINDDDEHVTLEIALSAANSVAQLPSFSGGAQAEMIVSADAQIRFGRANTIDATTANRDKCLAYDAPAATVITIPPAATHIAATGTGTLRLHFGVGL